MQSFNERFLSTMLARHSHLCVGLDPDWAKLNNSNLIVQGKSEAECKNFAATEIVRVTTEYAGCYKPNAAFFEFVGDGGESIANLTREICDRRTPPPIVIFDGKRGDIGNTCEQYAQKVLGQTTGNYDAVTVNPLMGTDCVEPFLRDPERGIFALCLTSNPGAEEFLMRGDLYLHIAETAASRWNTNHNCGLVVGATRPEYAKAIRDIAPELPLLIPGVGAQGAPLDEILDAIDAKNNRRFVINASRSIMFPKADTMEARTAEAARLCNEINRALEQ